MLAGYVSGGRCTNGLADKKDLLDIQIGKQKMAEPPIRKCPYCLEWFQCKPGQGHEKREHCFKPECVEAKKEHWREKRRRYKAKSEQEERKSYKKIESPQKRPDESRECLRCGKDPYPNMFYCPGGCHSEVSSQMRRVDDNWVYMEGEI